MDRLNARIARHYSSGELLERFRHGLRRMGANPEALTYDDVAGGDEFHVGGAEATEALLDQLAIGTDMHVLDIGAGVGGVARRVARRCGCRVTGVDITSEFVETAEALTAMVGMEGPVGFLVGSGPAARGASTWRSSSTSA